MLARPSSGILERDSTPRGELSNTRWRRSREGEIQMEKLDRITTNAQMEKLDRITTNAARMNGEPCIRDLRLAVRRVLEALAVYPDRAD